MSSNDFEYTVQENKFLPFKIEHLTPEMIRKAQEELNETPGKRKKELAKLKNLIYAVEDFRPRMDDKFLLRFLRAKKFNPESAMKTLKNYYSNKTYYKGKITDRLPSEVKKVLDLNFAAVMPQRDKEGRVIITAKMGRLDLSKVSVDDVFATAFYIAEILLQSEATQICGIVYASDHKGMSLRLVRQLAFHPHTIRVVKAFHECVPLRINSVHLINVPFYYKLFFNVVRPLFSQKLRSRIHFHGENLDSFHEKVPPEILPRDFGGNQGSLNSNILAKEVLDAEYSF